MLNPAFSELSSNWKLREPRSAPPEFSLAPVIPTSSSMVGDAATIGDLHDHIASLERALHEEVDRRMSSEDRIKEQVDSKMKIAIDRLADVTETEMVRMYRRIEADVMNRLDSMAREVSALSSSVVKLNRQIEVATVEVRQNRETISKLEAQSTPSSRRGSRDDPQSRDPVRDMAKSELSKLHEVIDNDLKLSKKIEEINDFVTGKIQVRLELVEEWLKGSLTPEMLRLKESIRAERFQREEHDKEIMDIVSQYTDVMRRHFNSVSSSHDEIKTGLPASTREGTVDDKDVQPGSGNSKTSSRDNLRKQLDSLIFS